jgi:hypothetical protein
MTESASMGSLPATVKWLTLCRALFEHAHVMVAVDSGSSRIKRAGKGVFSAMFSALAGNMLLCRSICRMIRFVETCFGELWHGYGSNS